MELGDEIVAGWEVFGCRKLNWDDSMFAFSSSKSNVHQHQCLEIAQYCRWPNTFRNTRQCLIALFSTNLQLTSFANYSQLIMRFLFINSRLNSSVFSWFLKKLSHGDYLNRLLNCIFKIHKVSESTVCNLPT